MPDRYKVARDIMTLLQTIEEGMEHMEGCMQSESALDTSYLFDDIVNAITSILKSIQAILPQLVENQMLELSEQLIAATEVMTSAYEQKDEEKVIIALRDFRPGFKAWQSELNRCLLSYTAS